MCGCRKRIAIVLEILQCPPPPPQSQSHTYASDVCACVCVCVCVCARALIRACDVRTSNTKNNDQTNRFTFTQNGFIDIDIHLNTSNVIIHIHRDVFTEII